MISTSCLIQPITCLKMISSLFKSALFSLMWCSKATQASPGCDAGGLRQTAEMAAPSFRTGNALFWNEWHFTLGCSHTRPTEMHLAPPAALFHFVSRETFTKAQSTWTLLLHIRINSSTKLNHDLNWFSWMNYLVPNLLPVSPELLLLLFQVT